MSSFLKPGRQRVVGGVRRPDVNVGVDVLHKPLHLDAGQFERGLIGFRDSLTGQQEQNHEKVMSGTHAAGVQQHRAARHAGEILSRFV